MSMCAPCEAGDHFRHFPKLGGICIGCPCPVVALDDTEAAVIAPGLIAIPLKPAGPDEPIAEGEWGITPDGWRWQRRDGLFYTIDGLTDEEAAHPDEYANLGWMRSHIEDAHGPLTEGGSP